MRNTSRPHTTQGGGHAIGNIGGSNAKWSRQSPSSPGESQRTHTPVVVRHPDVWRVCEPGWSNQRLGEEETLARLDDHGAHALAAY